MVDTAGGGSIVNISSRSSDMVETAFVAYGAAKAALNMMTRNLAAELAPRGAGQRAQRRRGGHRRASTSSSPTTPCGPSSWPVRRWAGRSEPQDIACAALYLASPAASWVTGKVVQVDGGVEAPAISGTRPAAGARHLMDSCP